MVACMSSSGFRFKIRTSARLPASAFQPSLPLPHASSPNGRRLNDFHRGTPTSLSIIISSWSVRPDVPILPASLSVPETIFPQRPQTASRTDRLSCNLGQHRSVGFRTWLEGKAYRSRTGFERSGPSGCLRVGIDRVNSGRNLLALKLTRDGEVHRSCSHHLLDDRANLAYSVGPNPGSARLSGCDRQPPVARWP